jgi:putative DNA primase/helicase
MDAARILRTRPDRNYSSPSYELQQLARALGGNVVGAQVLCPGPGHSPKDRSLAVRPSIQSPYGFIAHSHCGDNWRQCRDFVVGKLGPTATWQRLGDVAQSSAPIPFGWRPLWDRAETLGNITRTYFASRGIPGLELPDVHGVLRFHPRCPFGPSQRHPCILAMLRDAVTNESVGIHRTALSSDGNKLDRKVLGTKSGAVIKLWPDDEVTDGLVIGEGIETTLAAATCIKHRGTLLRPAWAAVDAGNLARFPVLAGVECLTILVDHDESGAGQRAAHQCAQQWSDAGREVTLLTPRELGSDFNDIVRGAL